MTNDVTRSLSGAAAAQAGYDYQLNVSVLAALKLLLITKSATRITLEPANEEDLEADLITPAAGRVMSSGSVSAGYKLVVQVKFDNGDPWSIANFKSLLEHGEKRRPAKELLDDLNVHYLLVTNADTTGVARGLLVEGFEESPRRDEFPSSLSSVLRNSPEGRVAIWGKFTKRHLELEIKEALTVLLRVPSTRQSDCLEHLRREAKRRMSGTEPGDWLREDLLATIRTYGGYLASSAELDSFVQPSNFAEMKSLLDDHNAIVIKGRSGAGKTLAAHALCDQLRQRVGSMDIHIVNPADGPASASPLMDTGAKVYYIEDPWGQFSIRGDSDAWTVQLPRLLRNARPDRRYVITSRTDMLRSARAEIDLGKWSIVLDAEHYAGGQLKAIYDRRMEMLAASLQPTALFFREEVLSALETPLELDLFFTHLADGRLSGEDNRSLFNRLIKMAHRDAVEGVVIRYLDSMDTTEASAVIWALLAARSQFDRASLTALQRGFRGAGVERGFDLEKVVDRLIATHHLRQPLRVVSFAHPSVRAGFEAYIKESWERNESVLQLLINALTELKEAHQAWGLETAARAVREIRYLCAEIPGANFIASAASRQAIDAWIEESLLDCTADIQPLLELASEVGSEASVPSDVARWFMKGQQRAGAMFVSNWRPPFFSEDQYRRMYEDGRSRLIADRFIREVLPRDHGHYGRSFAVKIDRIATELESAFIAAAQELVSQELETNVPTIAQGAVRDLQGYEVVLADALDALLRLRQANAQDGGRRIRAFEDGVFDYWEEEHFNSLAEREGYAAMVIVETYVSAKREAGHWGDLMRHSRSRELGRYWSKDLWDSHVPVSLEEVVAMLDAVEGSEDEYLGWDAASKHWHISLHDRLKHRLLSIPEDRSLRSSLARCVCANAPYALVPLFVSLESSSKEVVRLLVDVHVVQQSLKSEKVLCEIGQLPPALVEIYMALDADEGNVKPVGRAAQDVLNGVSADCAAGLLGEIVPIMMASGEAPAEVIRRWLAEARGAKDALAATNAAIVLGNVELVSIALGHDRADARRAALEYLANQGSGPLPENLLNLAGDESSRVRRALVKIADQRRHEEHLSSLMQLARDRWSDAEPHYDMIDSYPIAREAVLAMQRYGSLPASIGVSLIELGMNTPDRQLQSDALFAAAGRCEKDIRARIWDVAMQDGSMSLRVSAANALVNAPTVEIEIIKGLSADDLLQLPPLLAASATILVGQHFPVSEAVGVLERVGQSDSRRVLILLGAGALWERDSSVALGLLKLLGDNHPARALVESDTVLVPPTALDDLGHVQVRESVWQWFADRSSS